MNNTDKSSKKVAVWGIVVLVLVDIIFINLSAFLAYMLRFDFDPVAFLVGEFEFYCKFIPFFTIMTIIVFAFFRLYRRVWRVAGVADAISVVFACVLSSALYYAVSWTLGYRLPRSSYITTGFLLIIFTVTDRFIIKAWRFVGKNGKTTRRIMIVGAGVAGNMLINEIKHSNELKECKVVCVIDDDPAKKGQYINNIKIAGGRNEIRRAVERYKVNEIIFAIPSIENKAKAEILRLCKSTGCDVKVLPGVFQFVNDDIHLNSVRNIKIEDLLGRDPIEVELDSIMGYVKDKTVMVTGGGGSIGSELCRQIAAHSPKRLIIFDIYENNAYDIQNELKYNYPDLDLVTLIGSVRDTARINSVMEQYRPNIVYHAAAHKHVPLMEDSPNESIKNNVFGTLKTAQAADKYGVERFVLISTDKAVNPTNIMGASKRMCEMIVQTCNKHSKTDFVAVRFGNVLGSNGSVIPLFQKQIEAGGPVTVTDPNIIRYFMTIPEAVSLVLQAGAFAKGGEIFVLDMGEPVKILDLAENLITLSGHTPNVDIMIEFTGLRPGEKKYEELLMAEEGLSDTANHRIHIGKPIEMDEDAFMNKLEHLREIMMDDNCDIRAAVHDIVPTYNYKKN